jgi:hypothetical protein
MTSRCGPPPRPTTPTDPTLATHPVPRKKTFPIRSFGPGVAIDTSTTDVDAMTERWETFERMAAGADDDGLENRALLEEIKESEAVSWREDEVVVPQPTWGFYVFMTDHDEATKELAPRAIENWVQLIRQVQGADNADEPSPCADEVLRRFRLDLVDIEEESVPGQPVSIDRMRECFRALVRSLEISDNDGEDEKEYFSVPPPTRNMVCLALDADKVRMLATLSLNQDSRTYEAYKVQAVDIKWQRPKFTRSSREYRGVMDLCIIMLARAYIMCIDGLGDYSE